MFVDFVHGFKDRYYLVRPMIEKRISSLMETWATLDQDGVVITNNDENHIFQEEHEFPLYCYKDHFKLRKKTFICSCDHPTVHEQDDYAHLISFMDKFEPYVVKGKLGNVLQVLKSTLIQHHPFHVSLIWA